MYCLCESGAGQGEKKKLKIFRQESPLLAQHSPLQTYVKQMSSWICSLCSFAWGLICPRLHTQSYFRVATKLCSNFLSPELLIGEHARILLLTDINPVPS